MKISLELNVLIENFQQSIFSHHLRLGLELVGMNGGFKIDKNPKKAFKAFENGVSKRLVMNEL